MTPSHRRVGGNRVRWPALLALVLLGGVAPPPGVGGQEVVTARVLVDLTGDAVARVRTEYGLRWPAGASPGHVPVQLLRFGDVRVDSARARLEDRGRWVPLALPEIRHRILRDSLLPGALASGPQFRLEVDYTLDGVLEEGEGIRWRIPILQVGRGAAEALPETFRARIRLPEGVRVYESFPTGVRPAQEEGAGTGASTVRVDLQVVPGVLTLRARREDHTILPPLALLDGAVVLLLGVLGMAGWRYMARLEA